MMNRLLINIVILFGLCAVSTAQESTLPDGDFDIITIPIGSSVNPGGGRFDGNGINEMGLSVNPVVALDGTQFPLGEVNASADRLDIRLRAGEAVLILSAPLDVSSNEVYFSCLAESQGDALQQSAMALIDNQDFNNLAVNLLLNQDIPRERTEFSFEYSPKSSQVLLLIQLVGPATGESTIRLERLRVLDGYTDLDYSLGSTQLSIVEHFGHGIEHVLLDNPPSQGSINIDESGLNRNRYPNIEPRSLQISTTISDDILQVSIPMSKQDIQPVATGEYLRVYAKAYVQRISGDSGIFTTALASGVSGSFGYTQYSISSIPDDAWMEVETPVHFLEGSTNSLIMIMQIRNANNAIVAVDDVSLHVRRESPYFWDSGIRSIPTDTPTSIPPTATLTPLPPSPTATPRPSLPSVPVVNVPSGFFLRGSSSNNAEMDEMPQSEIYVSGFKADKYEVSNEFYNRFLSELTGEEKEIRRPGMDAFGDGWETSLQLRPNHPVVSIDWDDAVAFCEWRTQRENLAVGMKYRLPTEAEWEKMAKGGDDLVGENDPLPNPRYPWGDNVPDQGAGAPYANYNSPIINNQQIDRVQNTAVIDSYPSGASSYGMFNLSGNVWEWCLDLYQVNYYTNSISARDPMGPQTASQNIRVIRGGSFKNNVSDMRTAKRAFADTPASNDIASSIGFRCVLSEVQPTPTATPIPTSTFTPKPTATFTPVPPPTNTPRPFSAGDVVKSTILGIEMIYVPDGSFLRGSKPDDDFNSPQADEMPQRSIVISEFFIDRFEVTVALYRQFIQETNYAGRGSIDDQSLAASLDNPVVVVSYDDALRFIEWRNQKEGFTTSNGYRLPTEAEWEYAAGFDRNETYPWGNRSYLPSGDLANLSGATDGYQFLAPVTNFTSGISPLGVFNMAGNAAEWCADWYQADYYAQSPVNNPVGPENGTARVVRGASWLDSAVNARVAARTFQDPLTRNTRIGFRCVRPVQ